ncbi:hypothetical protein C9439_06725 [archaeon SCG-AAA382B04]|nr:hypothetical protein C9439_06725 [archaeon SCG-AAA382B04]
MKRVNIERDFEGSYKLLLDNYSKFLPIFSLMLAISVVIQLLIVISGGLSAFSFILTNKFSILIEAFNSRNFSLFFEILQDNPLFLLIVLITFLLVLIVVLLGYSAFYGAILELIKKSLVKEDLKTGYGLIGSKKFTKSIFKLHILFLFLGVVFFVPIYFLTPYSRGLSALYFLFSIICLTLIYVVFFFFAKEAIVSGDKTIIKGIRSSASFVTNNPLEVLFYLILFGMASLLIGSFNLAFSTLFNTPIRGLTNALMVFLIYPFFTILKMVMYSDWRKVEIKTKYELELKKRILNGFKENLRELTFFNKKNLILVLISFSIFIVGSYIGWVSGSRLPVLELPEISGSFSFPIFIHLMFHNLITALGITFSGFLFGIPTIGALLLNGFLVGVVSTTSGGLNAFLFGILPHGVIEIPALSIAGGVGLKLGGYVYEVYRGKKDFIELGKKMERCFLVIAGTIPLFLAAALIEALITPWFISIFLN